jgi:hypothetical protein
MTKEKICQYKEIRVAIPKEMIIRCFYYKGFLKNKDYLKTRAKSEEIEQAINRLQHIASVIDRILLKTRG